MKTHRIFVVYDEKPSDMGQIKDVLDFNNCKWDVYGRKERTGKSFNLDLHSALILLGGEAEPAKEERKWFRDARANRIAVLGICLGAQVLAGRFGVNCCRGYPDERLVDKGLIPCESCIEGKNDPILKYLPDGQKMCQWHSWIINHLPSHAVNLICSINKECVHSEAFRLDDRTYGLQFHPEVPSTEIPCWEPSESKPSREECSKIAKVGWDILDAWVKLALSVSPKY